jgi:hypothetical protein
VYLSSSDTLSYTFWADVVSGAFMGKCPLSVPIFDTLDS